MSEKNNLKFDIDISNPDHIFTEEINQVAGIPEILPTTEHPVTKISNNNSTGNEKVPLEANKISIAATAPITLNIGIL